MAFLQMFAAEVALVDEFVFHTFDSYSSSAYTTGNYFIHFLT